MSCGTSACVCVVSSGSSRSLVVAFLSFCGVLVVVVRGRSFCGSCGGCAATLAVNALKLSTTSAICLRIVISNLQTRTLLGPPPKQNYFDRLKDNDCVQDQTLVFDVEKIVLQLLPRIFDRRAVRILDLRPTGQPGRDQMSLLIKRNLLGELGHEVRPFRTWSNKAHLAFQDVPELRDLVDANFANDAADAGRARVAFAGPNRTILFGVNSHRAKLSQYKRATVFSDSFLFVKDRTTRFELDQHRRDQHDRQRQNCAHQGHQPVHYGAREPRELRLPAATREDQPRWAQHVQRNASGDSLVKRRTFLDRNLSGKTQLQ